MEAADNRHLYATKPPEMSRGVHWQCYLSQLEKLLQN